MIVRDTTCATDPAPGTVARWLLERAETERARGSTRGAGAAAALKRAAEEIVKLGNPLLIVTVAPGPPVAALVDLWKERIRQFAVEGCTLEHDDVDHPHGELAGAAAGYAWAAFVQGQPPDPDHELQLADPPPDWPFEDSWWKPRGARENLVRAGALILAEIERLDRKAGVP